MSWYYAEGSQQRGPLSEAEFAQAVAAGQITPATLVWKAGMANWLPYSQVAPAAPSPAATPAPNPNVPASEAPTRMMKAMSAEELRALAGQPAAPAAASAQPAANAPAAAFGAAQQPVAPQPSGFGQQGFGQQGFGGAAAPQQQLAYCTECGAGWGTDDLMQYGERQVCPNCKDAFVQRLRQGAPAAAGTRRYAGFWIRFLARLIDGLLFGLIAGVMIAPFLLSGVLAGGAQAPEAVIASMMGTIFLGIFVLFLLGLCIEPWFTVKKGGTPGKLLLGLRIVRADGRPLDWGVAWGRYGMYIVEQVLCNFLIGYACYIVAAFDAEKRAVHDRVCDTRVVYK